MKRFNLKSQSGVSLVELLISVAIGMVIMYGVGTIFANNQRTFKLQENMARLQDTGRFAVDILKRDMRQAGYPRDMDSDAAAYPFFDAILFAGAATASPALDTTDDAELAAATDAITVMYQSGTQGAAQTYVDCLNNSPDYAASGGVNYADPEGGANLTFIKQHYYIQDSDADGVNELWCATYDAADTQMDNQLLVSGVEDMQILYGVDQGANTSSGSTIENRRTADQYLTAQAIRAGGLADNITAVRIGLLVSTGQVVGGGASDEIDYQYSLLGTPVIDIDDTSLRYRVYQFTSNIRNRSEP